MQDRQPTAPLFPPVNVTTGTAPAPAPGNERAESEHTRLLREILSAQDRQNELLEELVSQLGSVQRQRNQELAQWKAANPALAASCRQAAEALSRVQTSFLLTLTDEVNANAEGLAEGEFLLSEFVDRFGPRLAHLNGVLQVLAQLSAQSTP
ncbi:MAG TPA: hypothetical protein VG433_10215 [Pirellulales bacterium]|jgi:hypothetical protein|nr:hypothetical protein [Pirellulales bacterium]